jgi:hypothetical protein
MRATLLGSGTTGSAFLNPQEPTWTDVGLAAGAFFGLVGIVEIGYATSYALLAALSAVAVLWYSRSVRSI